MSSCTSVKAKDKILREGGGPALTRIVNILKIKETTELSMNNTTPTSTVSIHYARYDKKKGDKSKSTMKNDSTNEKKFYRCGNPFIKGHPNKCPAKDTECHSCGQTGQFEKCCKKKKGNFPGEEKDEKEKKKTHCLQLSEYYNEDGDLVQAPM